MTDTKKKRGKTNIQEFEYLENEKGFLDEINTFHGFWWAWWKIKFWYKISFWYKITQALSFQTFKVPWVCAPNHILSSNSAGKILKIVIRSEPLGLCSWNFWNFLFSMRLSNGEYFRDFKIFDLTWIWWIWLEWPYCLLLQKRQQRNP